MKGMVSMMGYGYGIGWFGMVIPLLLGALVIYAVVKLMQGSNLNNNTKNITGNDALDILNQRFASGEISEEEYMKKKKMIRD